MREISVTEARKDIFNLMKTVNLGEEPVIIKNKNMGDVVLMSKDEWESFQETLYLYSIPGVVDSILESAKEPFDEGEVFDPDEEW